MVQYRDHVHHFHQNKILLEKTQIKSKINYWILYIAMKIDRYLTYLRMLQKNRTILYIILYVNKKVEVHLL